MNQPASSVMGITSVGVLTKQGDVSRMIASTNDVRQCVLNVAEASKGGTVDPRETAEGVEALFELGRSVMGFVGAASKHAVAAHLVFLPFPPHGIPHPRWDRTSSRVNNEGGAPDVQS